jgi:hypothetical protein
MIKPHHLDHFVARYIFRLPENINDRKEDLVTLLSLLPKDYPRRREIRALLEIIRAHELAQMRFQELLNFNRK